MGDVGDWRTFSPLLVMQPGRELKGEVEAPRQKGDGWFHEVILRPVPSSNSLGGAAFRKCGIHAVVLGLEAGVAV